MKMNDVRISGIGIVNCFCGAFDLAHNAVFPLWFCTVFTIRDDKTVALMPKTAQGYLFSTHKIDQESISDPIKHCFSVLVLVVPPCPACFWCFPFITHLILDLPVIKLCWNLITTNSSESGVLGHGNSDDLPTCIWVPFKRKLFLCDLTFDPKTPSGVTIQKCHFHHLHQGGQKRRLLEGMAKKQHIYRCLQHHWHMWTLSICCAFGVFEPVKFQIGCCIV